MIEDYLNKLNKVVTSKSLTEDERNSIRSVLVAEMAKAPLGKFDSFVSSVSWYLSFMDYRKIVTAVTVSAVLFTMGGVSYAAESALPGDRLYVVKTDFNEAVVGLLAVSHKDKARVHTELAEKRLQEASQLAKEERLDEKNKTIISKKLKEHVSSVKEDLTDIVDKKDYVAAVEVSTEFEATLKAHSEVLVALVDQKDAESDMATQIADDAVSTSTVDIADPATSDADVMLLSTAAVPSEDQAFVSDVLIEVNASIAEIAEVREQAQEAVDDSVLVSKKNLAEEKKAELQEAVEEINRYLSSSSSTVPVDLALSASSTVNSLNIVLSAGSEEIESEDYSKAFRTFNRALLVAREAEEKLEAVDKLEENIVVATPMADVEATSDTSTDTQSNPDTATSSQADVPPAGEQPIDASVEVIATSTTTSIQIDDLQ